MITRSESVLVVFGGAARWIRGGTGRALGVGGGGGQLGARNVRSVGYG